MTEDSTKQASVLLAFEKYEAEARELGDEWAAGYWQGRHDAAFKDAEQLAREIQYIEGGDAA